MAIPMGSFVRGEIVEAKRPGRIRGRGEFRIALNQLTFPNGYTIELRATPSSVDRDGQEGVTPEGKVKGPGGVGKDVGTVLLITAVGGPVGGYAGLLAGSTAKGNLAIGHGVGAAAGLIVVLLTRGPEAELPRGTTMDVVFDRPLVLDAASLPANAGAGVDPQPRTVPMPADSRQERREWQKKRMRQSMLPSLFLLPF
jgi:type IV secretion system protein VirB10